MVILRGSSQKFRVVENLPPTYFCFYEEGPETYLVYFVIVCVKLVRQSEVFYDLVVVGPGQVRQVYGGILWQQLFDVGKGEAQSSRPGHGLDSCQVWLFALVKRVPVGQLQGLFQEWLDPLSVVLVVHVFLVNYI